MKRLTRAKQADSFEVTDFELALVRGYRKIREASWNIFLAAAGSALGAIIVKFIWP